MKYQKINKCDIGNGKGIGVSLWVSGCRRHCVGCFNKEAWDFDCGVTFTDDTINEILEACNKPYIDHLSLLGGEVFDQTDQEGLLKLVRLFKELYPDKDIWVWTGYEFDEIKDMELIKYCDVVVVGPFILEQRDISDANRWRGSRNQKIILVQESLKKKSIVYMPNIPNNN